MTAENAQELERLQKLLDKTPPGMPEERELLAKIKRIRENDSAELRPNRPIAPNPFGVKGCITDPAQFFDREELLRQIFEELGKGVNISLVGESSVGKSSLLRRICALAPEQRALAGFRFHYLSLQVALTEDDFYDALCETLGIATCQGYALARALRGQRHLLCLDEIEVMARAVDSQNVAPSTSREALLAQIAKYLLFAPNLHEGNGQRTFAANAALDQNLMYNIAFGIPAQQFTSLLVGILKDYGTLQNGCEALTAVIQETQKFGGIGSEIQQEGERLLDELRRHAAAKKNRANSVNSEPARQGFSIQVRSHLRGLADGADAPLKLVIASRSPLARLFPDSPLHDSPLAGICRQFDVLPFSREISHAFITQRLAGTGVAFTEAQIERLFAETGGHPARLQEEAAKLFSFER